MKHDPLKQWLNKQTRRITKDASSLNPHLFPETIHSFRTGTKKLRAMLRLIDVEEAGSAKLPRAFRKLYHATGDLRDHQVLMQMVVEDKQHSLSTFANWLSYKIGAAAHALIHKHSHRALRELHDHVAHVDPKLDEQALDYFFSERLKKIKSIAQHRKDEESLHQIRKEAKDMQYVLVACKKIWPDAYERWAPIEDKLNQLTDKAGTYNDHRNLLDMLAMYKDEYGPELNGEEIMVLVKGTKHWTKAKAARRKELFAAIRELVSPKTSKLLPYYKVEKRTATS